MTATIAFIALCITATSVKIAWKSHREKTIAEFWRDFDKVSMQYPEMVVAGKSGELDCNKFMLDGKEEKFARYIWYLSLLCFCIEQTINLRGQKDWNGFFDNQIKSHRKFFETDWAKKLFLHSLSSKLQSHIQKTLAPKKS